MATITENYKEKLKEALNSDNTDYEVVRWIEWNFPELKERKDERIRKAIIYGMTALKNQGRKTFANVPLNDCIAWLEKQSKDNMGISEAIKQKLEDNLNKALEKETPESWNKFLEEQSEQKNWEPVKPISEEDKLYLMPDEQKPTDKVELKFKVGDWITFNRPDSSKEIFYIYAIRDNRYYFNNNIHFSWSVKECDEKCHLWTIKDAKDGDVLYCESNGIEYIVMSKGINKYGHIDSYFRYNSLNGFGIDIPSVFSTEQDNITPATKEQRNLLFKKMHEAGYEWDVEKKELKKIEQTNAWSEEDETTKNNISHIIRQYDKISKSENQPCYYVSDCLLWMQNIKERVQPQPKQEWSEKDKRIMQNFLSLWKEVMIEPTCDRFGLHKDEIVDFLKSLKDRYIWKPSDKQMQQLGWVAEQNEHNLIGKELMTLYKDLKKLREE